MDHGNVTKYRPICLLNDVEKILEKLLTERIIQTMNQSATANLSESQYGYRKGRSAIDALMEVRTFAEEVIAEL